MVACFDMWNKSEYISHASSLKVWKEIYKILNQLFVSVSFLSLLFRLTYWLFRMHYFLTNGIRYPYMSIPFISTQDLMLSQEHISLCYEKHVLGLQSTARQPMARGIHASQNRRHRDDICKWTVNDPWYMNYGYILICINVCDAYIFGQARNRSTRILMMSCRTMVHWKSTLYIGKYILLENILSIRRAFISIARVWGISKVNANAIYTW